uniref:GATA-type domain-containing protein n=1 Tax=Leersia perrieri TaxID=77586 RepID=A0A0D9VMD9_9ORYZ
MAGVGFVEEMLREQSLLEATCGDLFDHIDDLLDFPKEESAADVLLLDAPAPGSPLSSRIIGGVAPPPPPATATTGQMVTAALRRCSTPPARSRARTPTLARLPYPTTIPKPNKRACDELDMDMAQLEWLSELFDDGTIPHEPSFPAGVNCTAPIKSSAMAASTANVVLPDKMVEEALFRSSSPISVLEQHIANGGSSSSSSSSASSSSESFAWSAPVSPRPEPPVLIIPARARSKRSRPSAFPAAVRSSAAAAAENEMTILVPTPMYSSTSSQSDPESIAESSPHTQTQPPMKKKKKAKKPALPAASDGEGDADADYEEEAAAGGGGGARALPPGTVRRCTHCQIEKTPQWRAGPLGPKTLCNACGVRYKSGRLFPEYRPAASPTFVPSIHSNSHKKVVEMRQKVTRNADPSCDLLQYIRRRD